MNALPSWDQRSKSEQEEASRLGGIMREIYNNNVQTIRYKFVAMDDDLVKRSQGTSYEIDPTNIEAIRSNIKGVEKSNDTSSLNKDTSTQKKIIVVATD